MKTEVVKALGDIDCAHDLRHLQGLYREVPTDTLESLVSEARAKLRQEPTDITFEENHTQQQPV